MKTKICKVIMLPTENKANILKGLSKEGKLVCYSDVDIINDEYNLKQHLYLVSDEEIKEGDYAYDGAEVFQCHNWDKPNKIQDSNTILAKFSNGEILERKRTDCKKIIATTDKFLKLDGSERNTVLIPESFIKAYVEAQGKIDEVMIEYYKQYLPTGDNSNEFIDTIRLRPDNTVIIHQAKTYTRQDLIYCVSEVAASLGLTPTSADMKKFNDATNKWVEQNL